MAEAQKASDGKASNDEVREGGVRGYISAIASGRQGAIWAAGLVQIHGFTKEEQHSMNVEAFKQKLEDGVLSAIRNAEQITKKIDITEEDKRAAAAKVLDELGDYAKMVKTVTKVDEDAEKHAEKVRTIWDGIIRPQMEKEL